MEQTPTFDLSQDPFSSDLHAKRMADLAKYDTRYFFCPFQDVTHNSLSLGYAPGGEIVALDPPRKPIPVWDLPLSGAETLGFAKHTDQNGNEIVNKAIVIYLLEPGPIISQMVQGSLAQGGTEIRALKGMPGEQFKRLGVNGLVFGDPIPRTAEGLRARMREHLERARADGSEGAQKLAQIAAQIIQSVDRCLGYSAGVLQETHADMESGKAGNKDAKKRYDSRDRRALEFSGATGRDEVQMEMAREQRETQKAIPTILERMAAQEERWARMFETQTEILKTLAASVGNGGAQPATDNQPKAKK